ncbi:hypothetical protein [Sulfurimonas sp.]|uniref:hypothetical protein n=1 Tax=Sulfurimonas sp. TaxID=2022749 RepID=UPI0025E93F69|nr:hypothetical protein [Sulfurimonas sp.]MBW6489002.1 hypothetical protein [Sulfurimonas sp.]
MKTVILYFLVALNLLLVLGLGYVTREANLIFSENLRGLEKKVHAWSPLKYEDSDIIELDLNKIEELKKSGVLQ